MGETDLQQELERERQLRREAERQVEALNEFLREKLEEFKSYGEKITTAFEKKEALVSELRARIAELEGPAREEE